ncbi:MAG TPA: hypothetical protein VGP93_13820 [Polyangiaceae bacterium]|nr:hypothetical protein [Polyangiaceae bacterium]
MKSVTLVCVIMGLALVAGSCVSYTGVSKSPDGELYISGGTNYFVYSSPWVRRCKVEGEKLECVELSEAPKPAASSTGAAAAPAPSSEPSASAAPEADPAPETKPAAAKSKK